MGKRVALVCLVLVIGCKNKNNGPYDGGGGLGGGGGGGFGGTGGSGGGGPPPVVLKPKLDLTHVVGFALSKPVAPSLLPRHPGDWALDAGAMTSQLYAIDDQGNLTVTTVTTTPALVTDGGVIDGGTTTTTMNEQPVAIFDTPSYVVIGYNGLILLGGTSCDVVLRKSDGALFCLPATSSLANSKVDSNGGDQLFITDINGGSGSVGAIYHVDLSAAPPTATKIVDSGTWFFDVNLDADTLVAINMQSTAKATRIVKANGGLQNLLPDQAVTQWLSTNGHDFYYLYYGPQGSAQWYVAQAARQADGSFNVTSQGMYNMGQYGAPEFVLATASDAYGIMPSVANNDIVELLPPNQGMLHPVTALTTIQSAVGVGSSIYVQGTDAMGNGGIVRVDVPSFTQTTVLAPGAFTLTAITLSSAGDLTFAGLRNSDGARVVGNVPAGTATYTILSATAPTVAVLTRIN